MPRVLARQGRLVVPEGGEAPPPCTRGEDIIGPVCLRVGAALRYPRPRAMGGTGAIRPPREASPQAIRRTGRRHSEDDGANMLEEGEVDPLDGGVGSLAVGSVEHYASAPPDARGCASSPSGTGGQSPPPDT